jgi:polyhydroxyalkanoate synthase
MDSNMNMPDPQDDAPNPMSGFADPALWQSWFKMPEMTGSMVAANPLAGIFKDAGVTLPPAALETIRNDYLQKAAGLWQDFLTGQQPALHDRRFSSTQWLSNPLSAFSAASYLLNSEFLMAMADAVEAPSRERQKIRFAVQQMVDAMSPANFLATNPEAQHKLIETKGESLTQGIANMLADMQKGRISQSDESAFEVGRNVATTPGQVVFENLLANPEGHSTPRTEYEGTSVPEVTDATLPVLLDAHFLCKRFLLRQGGNRVLVIERGMIPNSTGFDICFTGS